MTKRTLTAFFFSCLLTLCGAVAICSAQSFDISSGGQPTITGAVGGSISGSSDVRQNLSVTVNFGELSPANPNSLVKVVIPIAIRSTAAYQISVSFVTGTPNTDPQAIQPSDVGFGVVNLRPMGNQSQICNNHTIVAPYNNDPSQTVTIGASGRATYPSSFLNVIGSPVVLRGPRLTRIGTVNRAPDNGYIFDAIFVIKPQFYSSGISSATINFNISAGPNVSCQ
jgi:hypothetical protein